ncbi:MAG: hypothetical protein MJ010_02365 [Paludibacteraceae bacterium]|nr:hypothetical protein [Paludibacteraceae bacterium]
MEVKILKLADKGDIQNERLILKVVNSCNLGWFIVMDNTYNDNDVISNLWRHVYILPSIEAKEGDFVWLYTKQGSYRQRGNDSGTTTFEMFWGMDCAIWNADQDEVHLIRYIDSENKLC